MSWCTNDTLAFICHAWHKGVTLTSVYLANDLENSSLPGKTFRTNVLLLRLHKCTYQEIYKREPRTSRFKSFNGCDMRLAAILHQYSIKFHSLPHTSWVAQVRTTQIQRNQRSHLIWKKVMAPNKQRTHEVCTWAKSVSTVSWMCSRKQISRNFDPFFVQFVLHTTWLQDWYKWGAL